jgi:hypothetical protein
MSDIIILHKVKFHNVWHYYMTLGKITQGETISYGIMFIRLDYNLKLLI